jgi:hypothetical protein
LHGEENTRSLRRINAKFTISLDIRRMGVLPCSCNYGCFLWKGRVGAVPEGCFITSAASANLRLGAENHTPHVEVGVTVLIGPPIPLKAGVCQPIRRGKRQNDPVIDGDPTVLDEYLVPTFRRVPVPYGFAITIVAAGHAVTRSRFLYQS